MAKLSAFLLILILAVLSWSVDASGVQEMSWVSMGGGGRCQGSVADCMVNDEFDMDTEINRRILATTDYISYGALQRDTIPCSQRGASYYNCKSGAQANPYNRGCTQITRCRS